MLSLPCEASTEVQTSDRRLTQKCQAELEDVEESAAATYEHDPEAADEVAAELCDAIRDMVAYVLQPSTVWELCWSSAGFPTIMDVQVLAADPLLSSLAAGQRERLLDDQSAQTAVERGDGILPAVRIGEPQVRLTVGRSFSGVRGSGEPGGQHAARVSGAVAHGP